MTLGDRGYGAIAAPKFGAGRFPNCSLLSYFCGSLSEPQGERLGDLCLSRAVHPGNLRTQDLVSERGAPRTPLLSRSLRGRQK